MAFCHGATQAMVHIGVHPDPALAQLFRLCEAELVSMDDKDIEKMVRSHFAFIKTRIANGTYPSRPGAVTTFGTRVMLIASGDLDAKTVYNIVKVIYTSREYLKRSHPALSSMTMDPVQGKDINIRLHPGADTFFTEQGM